MAKLVLILKNEPRQDFAIDSDGITIGRGTTNDIMIPVIKVSRQHAKIKAVEDGFLIRDLESTNGTFVNGVKIQEKLLEDGDEILIEPARLYFKLEEEEKVKISQKQIKDMVSTVRNIMSESAEESKLLLNALERIETRVRSVAVRLRGAYQNSSALIFLKNDLMDLSEQVKKLFKDAEGIGRALQAQTVLIRLGYIIHSMFDVNQILEVCTDLIMESVEASRGVVFLANEEDTLTVEVVRERGQKFEKGSPQEIREELAKETFSSGTACIYTRSQVGMSVHGLAESDSAAVICLPFQGYQKLLGAMYLDVIPRHNTLDEKVLPVLRAIATQAATSVENAIMYQESLERDKLQRDLELAREIQYGLLPDEPPQIRGFQITASLSFAKMVGGDYYDFIPLDDSSWGILIADVSGKGIPAALIAATSKVQARALCMTAREPAQFLTRLNNILAHELSSDHYITMVYGILDPKKGTFTYSRAGHEPPFRSGKNFEEPEPLMKGGFPVGLFKEATYEQETLQLNPGDRLLLFTDGLSDCLNPKGESFSKTRVSDYFQKNRLQTCDDLGTGLLQEVQSFSHGGSRFDDMTLILLGRD